MLENNIDRDVRSAVESRKPSRAFKDAMKLYGENTVYRVLDSFLGDLPDGQRIRKTALAISLPEADLRHMADSAELPVRRVSRLILLESKTGVSEDPLLQKGLSDKSAVIRCDAARFTGSGTDRTRLYNHLIRLIREDPDIRVRRSAGKRLSDSFADLYSVDFNGLPPLSQMLIIDALEGHSRVDEERVESLLSSRNKEISYRAARTLQRWGTLKRLFTKKGETVTLKAAAALGVADYLEGITLNSDNKSLATELAGLAGREDLVRRFTGEHGGFENHEKNESPVFSEIADTVHRLVKMDKIKREETLMKLPLNNPDFKSAAEKAFPESLMDITHSVLFNMARLGDWKDWSSRILGGLNSGDPEIAASAIPALAEIDPETALAVLPPVLMNSNKTLRIAAAGALASIPSGKGVLELGDYLKNERGEEDIIQDVLTGIRSAGGAALARCILDNFRTIGPEIAGKLLSNGIDELGVELLADGIPDETELTDLLRHAEYPGGASILASWPALGESSRKKFLSSLSASSWGESIPPEKGAELMGILKNLSLEERKTLLEPVLHNAGGKHRRQIQKLIKG